MCNYTIPKLYSSYSFNKLSDFKYLVSKFKLYFLLQKRSCNYIICLFYFLLEHDGTLMKFVFISVNDNIAAVKSIIFNNIRVYDF